VIAFDTAFNAVALLFVIAAPVLVTIKIGLSRFMGKRAEKSSPKLSAVPMLIASTSDKALSWPSPTLASNVLDDGNQRQVEDARLPA
jgi:hypothetical protein